MADIAQARRKNLKVSHSWNCTNSIRQSLTHSLTQSIHFNHIITDYKKSVEIQPRVSHLHMHCIRVNWNSVVVIICTTSDLLVDAC